MAEKSKTLRAGAEITPRARPRAGGGPDSSLSLRATAKQLAAAVSYAGSRLLRRLTALAMTSRSAGVVGKRAARFTRRSDVGVLA